MKKQYTVAKKSVYKMYVYLYHDDALIKTDEVWMGEVDEYIEKIELEGYVRGYTQEAFKAIEEKYHEAVQKYIEANASRIGW